MTETKEKIFKEFGSAIDQIDDYFEYRCRSDEDQAYVQAVLSDMEMKIRRIRDAAEETKST